MSGRQPRKGEKGWTWPNGSKFEVVILDDPINETVPIMYEDFQGHNHYVVLHVAYLKAKPVDIGAPPEVWVNIYSGDTHGQAVNSRRSLPGAGGNRGYARYTLAEQYEK